MTSSRTFFDPRGELRLGKMIAISAAIHVAAFAVLLAGQGIGPSRSITGQIYEVNLVEFSSIQGRASSQSSHEPHKEIAPVRAEEPAKMIEVPQTAKEKPVTLAKKVLETPKDKVDKPKTPPSKLIEDALSRIEKKVEGQRKAAKEKEALAKAVSEIGAQARKEVEDGVPGRGGGAVQGVAIQIYQAEVASTIKRNWSFPATHLDPRTKKELEAIVVVTVRSDGSIVNSRFTRRSPSPAFDESAMRAIDRSNPLPPFPEGYRMTVDEFEIRFNLMDLDNN
ncbi:MAG: TonB family protein [Desulfobacteraceae bacterium]|jgi:colicin import membrane protein|nr:MAG: TonB family protein [Desulfobacteraceae bacterium]